MMIAILVYEQWLQDAGCRWVGAGWCGLLVDVANIILNWVRKLNTT
jgi:hypothetical protein